MIKYKLKDIRDTMGQSEEIYHAKEVDKEIERLKHENEMTKLTCDGVQEKYEYAKKEIERLRKEKEWLLDVFVKKTPRIDDEETQKYIKNDLIIRMQQALKDK